ncbi:Predicted arabinose efflux permease, MFS family [Glycomyces sambucus]|uniref:Predicted arabinose efflux permease, MFS family n=1 Tax=Glycomyces sambucus TaxID=380244 RepID=A0A1G9IG70_9ACTN|nr:MFS transporter [Glycomyces sambucus]SDL24112.1 Predicted arabinose efflux permease, MFS family [Glycomyces sambucus]
MSQTTLSPSGAPPRERLPVSGLLALSTAVFITVITESLPAGLLPGMRASLGVGEAAMGQAVTVYAIGTALTVIPLSALTAGWGRRPVLLLAMAGFVAANTVTAVSTDYLLTMGARFVAGMAAGLSWALMVGYARRLAPKGMEGRAIAIVMAGIPLALALGVPAGTFIGGFLGWRESFGVMSALAVLSIVWITLAVPDFPGQRSGQRTPVARAVAIPGVAAVLAVIAAYVVAFNVLYTYIAAFLERFGMGGAVDRVLLVFGVASIASIWITGAQIDRRLRRLTIGAAVLTAAAATLLAVAAESPVLVYVAVALWGLGHGGVPTLLQTAAGQAGAKAADTVQAVVVTLWNAATAAGGALGGLLLVQFGPLSLAWTVAVLGVPVLLVALGARRHAFPSASGSPSSPASSALP